MKSKHPLVGDWDKFAILSQALALDGRISDGAKALYWVLACYRNKESGYSWPSMTTLRKCLGKGETTIRRLREELETWGLSVEYQAKSGRVRYRLNPYPRALDMNRRREQRGSQSSRTINEEEDWKKTTPESDQIHGRKPYPGHKATCTCTVCEAERKRDS